MTYEEYLKNKWPYQEDGHLFLLDKKRACLYFTAGKGKSFPCIEALRDINDVYDGKAKVLILSTADAIKNMWQTEIVPQNILPQDTTLMTFNSAILDKNKSALMKVKWTVIIVDECHKVKAHNTKISKLVHLLTKKCPYVWGLSGTPRGNSDVDIYCQFHNLNISSWGDVSYTYFIENVCTVEQKFFGHQVIKQPTGIRPEHQAGWERNIAMYTLRANYTEDDEMPDLNVNVVKLPYTPTKEYLGAEDGVINLPDYKNTLTKLTAINKAHQAANGFLYLTDEKTDKRTIYEFAENDKLKWLDNNLKLGDPTIIVYLYEADLNHLVKKFGKLATENVNEFLAGKSKLLLLQCSRCESMNLQIANRIIFYTMDYSFIKYNQMLHRVWRKGQSKSVQIDILLFDKTVEVKIWNAVKNKENLSQLFYSIKGA